MTVIMLLFKDILYDARVQREAKALAEDGHFVHIYCINQFSISTNFKHENITVIYIDLETKRTQRTETKLLFKNVKRLMKDIYSNVEYYKKIVKHINENKLKPEIVHCHDLNTLIPGYYLSKKYNASIVYDSHELFNEMASKSKVEKMLGYIVEANYIKYVTHLITVNSLLEQQFRNKYGNIPTTVIENIPELNEEENGSINLRDKFDISKTEILLLYQGGLNPERGLELLIYVVSQLPENYRLILIGDGRLKQELLNIVYELNIKHKVFFLPSVLPSQLHYYTKQADIGLLLYENTCLNNYLSTPNKIYEYLIAGIPVVTTNHPGKEIVLNKTEAGTSVLFESNEIVKAIKTISENLYSYKKKAKDANNNISWDNEKEKLIKTYRLLERSNSYDG